MPKIRKLGELSTREIDGKATMRYTYGVWIEYFCHDPLKRWIISREFG